LAVSDSWRRQANRRGLTAGHSAAREIGEVSLPDALAFCLLLAEVDRPRFDRAIARWHARFVLEASGITVDEDALALSAAKGLAGFKTRDVAVQTLRDLARGYGPDAIASVLAWNRDDGKMGVEKRV
jgi:hypothetical protein